MTTCPCPACGHHHAPNLGGICIGCPCPEGGWCCASCKGTGASGDPSANGQCWDCRGTGHPHSQES